MGTEDWEGGGHRECRRKTRRRRRGQGAYLRWGLGEGCPGCGRARQLRLVVDSDLWGGSWGAIWWRRRALVPFCRGVVTVEVRPERKLTREVTAYKRQCRNP